MTSANDHHHCRDSTIIADAMRRKKRDEKKRGDGKRMRGKVGQGYFYVSYYVLFIYTPQHVTQLLANN